MCVHCATIYWSQCSEKSKYSSYLYNWSTKTSHDRTSLHMLNKKNSNIMYMHFELTPKEEDFKNEFCGDAIYIRHTNGKIFCVIVCKFVFCIVGIFALRIRI